MFKRGEIRRQSFVARRIFARNHNRLAHLGKLQQRRFDFTRLDAEAADFHLVIEASEQFHFAVGPPARAIAGPVQAPAGFGAERIMNELLRRQFRAIEITVRQAVAADHQFTGHTGGNRLEMAVENVKLRVGNGPANDDGAVARRDSCRAGPDGRFRRTVKVPEFGAAFQELIGQFARQRFAAAKNPEASAPFPAGGEQHAPRGRRRLHGSDAGLGDLFSQ